MTTTLLLVERAPSEADVTELVGLHGDEPDRFVVLLPASGGGHGLLAALDDIAMADFRDVPADLEREQDDGSAEMKRARDELNEAVRRIRRQGAEATGLVVREKPLRALPEVVRRCQADEIVVLIEPHFVEEFFHTDWASRARRATGLPTLKLLPHKESGE